MPTISIIGPGRVGGALAIALSRIGFPVESIVSRSRESARTVIEMLPPGVRLVGPESLSVLSSEVVLVTTRDDQIETVAGQLAEESDCQGKIFLHTSGSRTSDLLAALKAKGGIIGSFHPLVSVSDPVIGSGRFEGAYFCVEGDAEAVAAAEAIAKALGGSPFEIPTASKPLYHAAAVMACGHLVALISEALEALAACGPDEKTAKNILLPLIQSTIGNLAEQDLPEALTGTFARGDLNTFRAHMAAFEGNVSEAVVKSYLLLGRRSLELAAARRDPPAGIDEFLDQVDTELSERFG